MRQMGLLALQLQHYNIATANTAVNTAANTAANTVTNTAANTVTNTAVNTVTNSAANTVTNKGISYIHGAVITQNIRLIHNVPFMFGISREIRIMQNTFFLTLPTAIFRNDE